MKDKDETHIRQYISNIIGGWDKAPNILAGRAICLVCLSFFVLVAGEIDKIKSNSTEFLGLSFCLFVAGLIKAYGIYRVARDKAYEIEEGMVIKREGRWKPGRFYRVVVMKTGGEVVELVLNKIYNLKAGKHYRFYMKKTVSGVGYEKDILGIEEMG